MKVKAPFVELSDCGLSQGRVMRTEVVTNLLQVGSSGGAPSRYAARLKDPLDAGVHLVLLDECAPRNLGDPDLYLLLEPRVIDKHAGYGLLDQVIRSIAFRVRMKFARVKRRGVALRRAGTRHTN